MNHPANLEKGSRGHLSLRVSCSWSGVVLVINLFSSYASMDIGVWRNWKKLFRQYRRQEFHWTLSTPILITWTCTRISPLDRHGLACYHSKTSEYAYKIRRSIKDSSHVLSSLWRGTKEVDQIYFASVHRDFLRNCAEKKSYLFLCTVQIRLSNYFLATSCLNRSIHACASVPLKASIRELNNRNLNILMDVTCTIRHG